MPVDLYLIQDIPHHDWLTPYSALYFSGRLVWVTGTNVVDDQKSKVVDFFVCCKNNGAQKYHKWTDLMFLRKEKFCGTLK